MQSGRTFKPRHSYRHSFWFQMGLENANTAQAVRDGFKPAVYRNIVEKAGLSQSEFHTITHIPLSTIKRRLAKDERFNMQESDVMYRLAMLIKLAGELFGDEERALEWMHQEVYGLGGKRPLDMVSTTADFETVKDLIGRIQHGVFS